MREQNITFKAKPESVDLETRTIRNAILAQTGEAKGHGFSVEQQFIIDLVNQANNGVLCNFGHNWDNMGLQLGRANEVKVIGNSAVGNLSIYANADNSPKQKGMGTWVLNQAKEDPESIMLSIRFTPSHFYQYDDSGKQVTLRQDWWGDPLAEFKDRGVFVGLRKLASVDVVDSGALTDKMFGEDKGFFQKFMDFIKKDKKDMAATPNNTPSPDEVLDTVPPVALAQITIGDKTFKAADVTKMLEEITALKSGDGELRTRIELLSAKVTVLQAENVELKAVPAAVLTNGATGTAELPKVDAELAAFGANLRRSGSRR